MPLVGHKPAATPTTRTAAPVDHEAAFSTWLTQVAQGHAADLALGAQLFAQAAAQSTLPQAKVAFAQVAMVLDKHRPDVKDAMFIAVQPFLVDKARAAGDDAAVAELQRGLLTFDVQIPDAVFDAAAGAADAHVRTMLAQLEAEPLPVEDTSARARGAQSQLAARAGAVGAVGGAAVKASDAQWGAFLGRVLSNIIEPHENALLDAMAAKGRVDAPLQMALKMSGIFEGARAADGTMGEARVDRIAAAMALARRAEYAPATLDDDDRKLLLALAQSDPTPTLAFAPPMTVKDGDLETLLLRWIGVTVPRLKTATVMNHPHIPQPQQMTGTVRTVEAVAQEHGKFLADYNVMTVMHQLGSAPPWLALLEEKLGLKREDYLGVAVPYSASTIAMERLNREKWETHNDHDPRPEALARLQDLFGAGNEKSFDELKEADIKRAVQTMLEKSAANGKKIMVIDDGGYVIKVLRKYFPEHEHKFKIVEWTTRGIRQLETVPDPKAPVVAAAETAPKSTIEPAFVADSTVLHFLAAVGPRLGSLQGKKVLVVGAGNIGNAVALALKEHGAIVSVYDRDPKKLDELPPGLTAVRDVKRAVKGQDAILAATGANSLGPEVFPHIDPGTLVTSASSVDIETRDLDQRLNGHWENGLVRATLRVSVAGGGDPRKPPGQSAARTEQSFKEAFAPHGLDVDVEQREILGGGYVLNLSRRARIMPLQREDFILMNVTEAIAVAHETTATGKVKVPTWREERIERFFAEEHPAEYARAQQFQRRG